MQTVTSSYLDGISDGRALLKAWQAYRDPFFNGGK